MRFVRYASVIRLRGLYPPKGLRNQEQMKGSDPKSGLIVDPDSFEL